jgi:predicted nucleic-acid-binding protein
MHAIDTNVLVRLLVRDDERQVAKSEAFVKGGAWVSHLVLAETLWVLDAVYDRNNAQIAEAVEKLLIHDDLVLQDEDVVAVALRHFRANVRVSFSDCLIVAIARKAGHRPVGTFDKNLAKIPDAQAL